MIRIAFLSSLIALGSASAADWPTFRGADRTDISTETGLLKTWPADGPKRVWLNENAGLGYSGFAVVGGTLYTMGARDAVEYVIAIDAATGKENGPSRRAHCSPTAGATGRARRRQLMAARCMP